MHIAKRKRARYGLYGAATQLETEPEKMMNTLIGVTKTKEESMTL